METLADALKGIRVLSMEQAAALPFATRHLVDLGAEVIRVQSHNRGAGAPPDRNYQRNKLMLGLDLSRDGGPELFRDLAASCDVVAHNFTPRVMEKYGIDWQSIKAIHPAVIYCSLTGFGATGPWSNRPLFGPGAEAVSGQNLMIGESDGVSTGRPGTITYADNICGLNLVFAILAALDHREETGEGQHIDISLYETGVCQIGAAISEFSFGAPLPGPAANSDINYVVHDVFPSKGRDKCVAIAIGEDQLALLMGTLGIESVDQLERTICESDGDLIADRLQGAGICASIVSDASDIATSSQLWERHYFGAIDESSRSLPLPGPAWGGGRQTQMVKPHQVGADNRQVLSDLLQLTDEQIGSFYEAGVIGEVADSSRRGRQIPVQLRIDRGELSRTDPTRTDWEDMIVRYP